MSALGFGIAQAPTTTRADQGSFLAAFADSETFRWLRRWVVVAVVAIVTPLSVITAYANQMPDFHHVAVPIAVAVIVPAWLVELSGARWPRWALIAATVLPNVWLTLIGHISTNFLWLLLLVGWIAFTGTRVEALTALLLALGTLALGEIAMIAPAIGVIDWGGWSEASFALILTWFMGLVLRRRVALAAANGHARMEVADDGVGFEPSRQGTGGFGLPGMRERVERLGGTLRIESSPGAGTRVQVEVPR